MSSETQEAPDPGYTQTRDDVLWGTVFACRKAIWGPAGTSGKGLAGKVKRLGQAIEAVAQSGRKTREYAQTLEARIEALEAAVPASVSEEGNDDR